MLRNLSRAVVLTSCFLSGSLSEAQVLSCNSIHPSDYNCDGIVEIGFTGDSIVFGVGDTRDREGYVGRIPSLLNNVTAKNIGVPGITSGQLLRAFRRNLNKVPPGETQKKARANDLIIIAVGINDYWSDVPPRQTVRNIRRLIAYLQEQLTTLDGYSPAVFASPLTPTTRAYQRPFVDEVNRYLKLEAQRKGFLGPRYDKLNVKYLSVDGLHPTPAGYNQLARLTAKFMRNLDYSL